MTSHKNTTYSYPGHLTRVVLLSMEEILGHNGLNAVLNQADLNFLISSNSPNKFERTMPFDEVSRIQASLEKLYGPRGGRGIALRSGRVFFRNVLTMFGEDLGITDKDFRLLPLEKKIMAGIEALAVLFNQSSDQQVKVEEQPERVLWIQEQCPFCWNRSVDTPVCYLVVGMLQEAFYWMSGGKYFLVEETECFAKGDLSCKIVMDKTSLD